MGDLVVILYDSDVDILYPSNLFWPFVLTITFLLPFKLDSLRVV